MQSEGRSHSSPESKKVFESIVGVADNVGVWAWPGSLRVSAGDRDFDAIVERMARHIDDGQMEASEDIAYELMNAYTVRGDNSNAIAKLTKIAHRLPLLLWPWHILGEMYRRMGNFEEAINVYESNVVDNLPFDYSYQRLATLYLSACNYLRVIECYEVLQEMIGPVIHDDPCRRLALYMNESIPIGGYWVPIDERFREHLLWYPISEAHKGKGDDCEAYKIYEHFNKHGTCCPQILTLKLLSQNWRRKYRIRSATGDEVKRIYREESMSSRSALLFRTMQSVR
jgi:tetratricopeptide (TPR) repeat protein